MRTLFVPKNIELISKKANCGASFDSLIGGSHSSHEKTWDCILHEEKIKCCIQIWPASGIWLTFIIIIFFF